MKYNDTIINQQFQRNLMFSIYGADTHPPKAVKWDITKSMKARIVILACDTLLKRSV